MCFLVCVKSFSRVCLCDPMDGSPPDSSVHGILQARILEWVAIPFSKGSILIQGLNPESATLLADSLLSESQEKPQRNRISS